MPPILSLLILLSLSATTAATPTTIGITYTETPNTPPPDLISTYAHSHSIPAVRLIDPSPSTVRSFSYTNTSLLISLPNSLIPSFSANLSAPTPFLLSHVLPFYPRAGISAISLGSDALSAAPDLSGLLLPALRNLRRSLDSLSLRKISVSTSLSFTTTVSTAFPPSSAEFLLPAADIVIKPLLNFLSETNSSLYVKMYPYEVRRLRADVPIGFAVLKEEPYSFIDDPVTGARYRNLFDMMIDAVVSAMSVAGHDNIPIVVAETGWPSSSADVAYAGMYNQGLIRHLRKGLGTPLRKEGVKEVYIYEMFDDSDGRRGEEWGLFYLNMTKKYDVDFSSAVAEVAELVIAGLLLLLGTFFSL